MKWPVATKTNRDLKRRGKTSCARRFSLDQLETRTLLSGSASSLPTQIVFSNFKPGYTSDAAFGYEPRGPGDGDDAGGQDEDDPVSVDDSFKTPNTGGWQLSGIKVALSFGGTSFYDQDDTPGDGVNEFFLSIRADNGSGSPGPTLVTYDVKGQLADPNPQALISVLDANGPVLAPNTQYWIEVKNPDTGGHALLWQGLRPYYPAVPGDVVGYDAYGTAIFHTHNDSQGGVFEIDETPLSSSGTPQVDLSSSFNRTGIVADGTTFSNGGLDDDGNALSANLLGPAVTAAGATFNLGPAGAADVVSAAGQTITLPSGNFGALSLLATGVNGSQANQPFTVTYSDGTQATSTRSISDWAFPQGYAGESTAVATAYRDVSDGTKDSSMVFNLYTYSLALDPTKTVQSLTLPNDGNVEVLGIDLLS